MIIGFIMGAVFGGIFAVLALAFFGGGNGEGK